MLGDHEMFRPFNRLGFRKHCLLTLAKGCLVVMAVAGRGTAQEALTAKSILQMPTAQSSKGMPVTLRGVVTEAVEQGMVVHDGTAGIWVYLDNSQTFRPGDLLQLEIGRASCRERVCMLV